MVDVLLATYNGEKFLPAQLESLFAQTYSEFRVFVLDDASTDSTMQILRAYESRHPDQMEVHQNPAHTGNPGLNFFSLLEESCCEYVMFCDQDDVWDENKVLDSLRAMQLEEERDAYMPLLVHTDLAVVSADLHLVSNSFMHMQNLDPRWSSLERLIAQNNVTGCTVLFNQDLRSLLRAPSRCVIHDWWTALTAAAFGKIIYLPAATVLYRQHSNNAIGAQEVRGLSHILRRGSNATGIRAGLARTYECARIFLETYLDMLSPDQVEFLKRYSELGAASTLERFRVLTEYHAYKKGLLRKFGQILYGGTSVPLESN